MKKLSKAELLHVAAMAVVVVFTVHCGAPETETEAPLPTFTGDGGLFVDNRDVLQVCVDMDEDIGLEADAVLSTLTNGLQKLRAEHETWKLTHFGEKPIVVAGCPRGGLPDGELEPKDTIVGPGLTERPSLYRLQIHVVGDEAADRVLGERQADRAIAELMKVGDHVVAEVSSALVMRASVLEESELHTRWLPIGLGLEPLIKLEPVEQPESEPKKINEETHDGTEK